jgi:predicted DNA-binding ribbon-helix-helix protein
MEQNILLPLVRHIQPYNYTVTWEASQMRKSAVVKRSIVIAGHKTSVSLEDHFWNWLKEIARTQEQTMSDLVAKIGKDREHTNLSSAIRLFVLGYVSKQAEAGARQSDETGRSVGPKSMEAA